MTNPIVVKEYSNIKLEDCDLVKLHHYLECKNLGSALKVTPDGIKTKSWVGVIKYKKIHLQILPKLIYTEEYDNQSEEEKESIKANILQNLIYMLSFVKKLEIKTSDAAKLSTTKNPFIEVLIRKFAKSLFDEYFKQKRESASAAPKELIFYFPKFKFSSFDGGF